MTKANRFLFLLAALLLFPWGELWAQREEYPLHEFSVNMLRIEDNSELLFHGQRFKQIYGLAYVHHYSNWGWTSAIHYGNNHIDDYCGGCVHGPKRSGRFMEAIAESGVRYTIGRQAGWRLLPFAEMNLCYSRIRFKYDPHPWYGASGSTNETIGLSSRAGVQWVFAGRGLVTCSSSLRLGWGEVRYRSSGKLETSTSLAHTLIQLGGGFLF